MPARRGRTFAQIQQLSEARSRSVSANPSPGASEPCSEDEEGSVQSRSKIQKLETLLKIQQKKCMELQIALSQEKEHSESLLRTLNAERQQHSHHYAELQSEKQHSQELYRLLRVERRARQRGNQRIKSLKEQLHALQSANTVAQDNLRSETKNASKIVDHLINMEKKNVGLQKELSAALNRATTSATEFEKKLKDAEKLKVTQLHV